MNKAELLIAAALLSGVLLVQWFGRSFNVCPVSCVQVTGYWSCGAPVTC